LSGFLGGYAVILWVQSHQSPLLDQAAVVASFIGTEAFFLVFVPLFYWCFSKRDGVRLTLVFLLSAYVNSLGKEAFKMPRPENGRVRVLYPSSGGGYSFPSGHAQNAVVFWGWLARTLRWKPYTIAFALLVLAISLSRIYLGLHFPADVVGGWIAGTVILGALAVVDHRISKRPVGWEGRVLPWAGVALPLLLFPWRTSPVQAQIFGGMLGFCLGYLLESRWLHFSPLAPWRHQLAKALGGWIVGAALALVLRVSLPVGDQYLFLQWALLGLWVSLGLPGFYVVVTRRRRAKLAPP
jgi:membrane-associated phospholipid phosphatase